MNLFPHYITFYEWASVESFFTSSNPGFLLQQRGIVLIIFYYISHNLTNHLFLLGLIYTIESPLILSSNYVALL
jgi:hypothetical protein